MMDPNLPLGRMLLRFCMSLPWERILVKPPTREGFVAASLPPPRYHAGQAEDGRELGLAIARSARPPRAARAAPPPEPAPAQRPVETASLPNRPGCTAADEAAVALFHLNGLAQGKGGFGVLRVSKERLETAATAAESIKHPEIAQQYRAIASEMPEVHTPEAAKALAERLQPVIYNEAWALGQRCKGALSPADLEEIKALAAKISARNKQEA